MSVLVVGISHHSAPVALLERLALDADGVAQADRRRRRLRARHRGDRARDLQPGRDLRRGRPLPRQRRGPLPAARRARRRSRPRRCCRTSTSTTTTARSRTCSRSPPGSTRWSSARARSSARPARRSRLGQEHGTVGPALNALFQQALRVGKRAHAETDIDRAAPSLVSRRARPRREAVGAVAGKRVARGRRRRDGRARGRHRLPAAAPPSIVVVNRTAGNGRPARRRVRRPRGRRWPTLRRRAGRGRRGGLLHRRTGVVVTADMLAAARDSGEPAARDHRPRAAARRRPRGRRPARRHPDRPGRPGRRAARHRRRPRGRRGPPDRRPRRSRPSSPPAARPASPRPWSRCARWPPRSSTPRWSGSTAGCPTSTTPTRAEVVHTVRRVADKLLHEPTVRVKELANEHGAVSYAAALAELFALDPEAVDAVTRPERASAMSRP